MLLKQAFAPLVDLIYPPRCPLCGDALAAQDGLCSTCWSTLAIPAPPWCMACQRPLDAMGATCGDCLNRPPLHDGITAACYYNEPARQLVLKFKHGRRIALAAMMARQIAARLGPLEGEWLAVPVPLHRWRLWQRGFNQSALIAAELARRTGAGLLVDGLLRSRATVSLGGLGRKERKQALKGAIALNPVRAARIAGAQVLLVDDVLTSGATTSACIAGLRKAGASKVRIACFARVLDH